MTPAALPESVIFILLAACRVAGLVYSAPIIGGRQLPRRIQLAFIVVATALVAPGMAGENGSRVDHVALIVPLVASEIALGASLGFALTVIVGSIKHAGQMIGAMSGLALGSLWNGGGADEVDSVSRLLGWFSIASFILIGGPGLAIDAVLNSFQVFPPGELFDGRTIVMLVTHFLQISITLAVQLALPLLLALGAGHFLVGLVARTSPHLAGFPVNALFSIGLILAMLVFFFDDISLAYTSSVEPLFESLGRHWADPDATNLIIGR